MYTGQPDILSWLLYVGFGFLSFVCVRQAISVPQKGIAAKGKKLNSSFLWLSVLVLAFTLLASFRAVGYKLGGADALNYVNIFLHSNDVNSPFSDMIAEPLYLLYCRVIRAITDNYRIFFAVSYGIIIISFCLFIKKFCPSEKMYYSPFILLIFPYLKGFCTLRTTFAAAFLLLGLVLLCEKKLPLKVIGCITIVASFFIHRMSVAFVPVFVFYFIYRWVEKSRFSSLVKGRKLIAIVCCLIVLSWLCARVLQYAFISSGILSGNDAGYISSTVGNTILSKWLIFTPQLLLVFVMMLFEGRYEETEKIKSVKIFCLYDVIILPAALVLGFWRVNEYLYIARIIMWGVLAAESEKLIPAKYRKIYKAGVFCLFLFWLIFRIYSEWNDLKIMPYIFSF